MKIRFCQRGHDLNVPENVYIFKKSKHHSWGGRQCLICRKLRGVAYHKKHKEKINARTRKWQRDNPEKCRARERKHNTGWTDVQYKTAMKKQKKRCAICLVKFVFKHHHKFSPHADHNHLKKKTRALLCGMCNWGLGKFRENPKFLRKAAKYLEKWR